ncbi:MAG: glycerol kinase GlpK [Bacillota bacterium]|nr:glycerol kinase GlpK [Bacillota bacterium]MDD4263228.1 glycerol kinase GlpK [Bacillota bacterium]
MEDYVLALDQGTTSSRAIVFDKRGQLVSEAHKEFRQIYPKPGWVEHDPMEIWGTQIGVAYEAIAKANIAPSQLEALGITNQRETTIVWEKNTGRPICNAIVWQCRRTAGICDKLKKAGLAEKIRSKTGLEIDAYFSATKIKWILDNVEGAREKAERGELRFGTVDTWLIANLTKGKVYVTDYSNASRTMLFNIHTLLWDEELCHILGIPLSMLPEVKPSSYIYGKTDPSILGTAISIGGCAGDQQAALFGQCCFNDGDAKNTYGTGCFMLLNTGEKAIDSRNGLLTTIGWKIGDQVTYALEGSIFIGGAAVKWLRDELRMIKTAAESEKYAIKVDDTNGVYFVPAFVGLGAPYWDMYARGTMIGLTRGSNKEHFIRAVLESIAYQSFDVVKAMEEDSGLKLQTLKVDGGASANNFLMQFQADILDVPVLRPKVIEITALGAAYLAGLATGFWETKEDIKTKCGCNKEFSPNMNSEKRTELINSWHKAIDRAKGWANE